MHYKHDIHIPGEMVNSLNARLEADYDNAGDDELIFEREHEFSSRWKMKVEVHGRRGSSLILTASLLEPDGRQSGRERGIPGGIDQDYHFQTPGGDEYTLTICRGAYATLDDDRLQAFVNDPSKCPHCAGSQLENDSLRLPDNGKVTTNFLCLDCKAEFRATYTVEELQTVKFPETGAIDA